MNRPVWIALVVLTILTGLIIAILGSVFFWIIGSIFFGILIWSLFGFRIVQQQQRKVVELFGRYYKTLKPGLKWILPGVMKIRAKVNTWEIKVPLFEEPVKIDFMDGSATPKGAEAFVRIKSPDERYSPPGRMERDMTGTERAIYEIGNWWVAVKDLLENAIRSYLNGLTIDEGITQQRAGFNLKNQMPEEAKRLEETLSRWGFELTQITIMDFDLEPELVKARSEVQVRERAAEAAKYVRTQRARETVGALVAMLAESTGRKFDEVQAEIRDKPQLAAEIRTFAQELVTRRMSLDKGALTDIRVQGGGDLLNTLAALVAIIRGGSKPPSSDSTPSTPSS